MTTSLIAAIGADGTIGDAGSMPWHLPVDMAHFKSVTSGHPVVMGRKTFESIGRALPQRKNIVVTRQHQWFHSEVEVCYDLGAALAYAATLDEDLFIIGGAEIYREALKANFVEQMIITWVDQSPGGDTLFPPVLWSQWQESDRRSYVNEAANLQIIYYQRRAGAVDRKGT